MRRAIRRLPRTAMAGLLLATAAFVTPLLCGESLPDSDDVYFAVQMATGVADAFREGIAWPKWAAYMNSGLGGPALLAYPPLSPWLTGMFTLLLGDALTALRCAAVAGTLLAGVAFYVAVRPWSSEEGATLAALLYVLLPYHFIDLYDRFAFAEFLAFVWAPLVFRFAREVVEAPSQRRILGLALTYAGLILTHVVTAFLMLFALGPYLLAVAAEHRTLRGLGAAVLAGVIALGGTAFYLLPLLQEHALLNADFIVQSAHGFWGRNLLFAGGRWVGPSFPGVRPLVERNFVVVLAAAAATSLLWTRAYRRNDAALSGLRAEGLRMIALTVWLSFLQIPLSRGVWASLPPLQLVQFPWRFALLQAVSVAWLAACTLAATQPKPIAEEPPQDQSDRMAFFVMLAFALPIAVGFQVSVRRPHHSGHTWPMSAEVQQNVVPEYFPRMVRDVGAVDENGKQPLPPARLLGPGRVSILSWRTHERRFRVEAEEPTDLIVATFFHPLWDAAIDGRVVEPQPSGPLDLIAVAVPAGSHEVTLEVRSRGFELLGMSVTVVTLAGLAIRTVASARRRGVAAGDSESSQARVPGGTR
jgi:6-pyruvoyl-tetrahydropterin synthase-like protein